MRKHCASVVLLFVIVLITCETCESLSLRMSGGAASSSNKSKKMHIEEVDEDKKVLFRYSIEKEKESTGLTREAGSVFWDRVKTFSIRNAARKTLLPIGYPASVPKEYTTFQCWNLVQDSSSFVRNILSMSAILKGMGVGSSNTDSIKAALLWILRDGAGMVGGLFFASVCSGKFNQNVKSWRLFADLINNVAMTLEIAAPSFPPQFFLPLISAASVCRALCGTAAGATGSAISAHWGTLENNTADVTAKSGAQHTILNLLCLAISLACSKLYHGAPLSGLQTGVFYACLTALHVFANYKMLRALALRTLNIVRLEILANAYIDKLFPTSVDVPMFVGLDLSIDDNSADSALSTFKHNPYSMEAVAAIEPIFKLLLPPIPLLLSQSSENCVTKGVFFFASITDVIHSLGAGGGALVADCLRAYKDEGYVVVQQKERVFCCFEHEARAGSNGGRRGKVMARAIFDCLLRVRVIEGRSIAVGEDEDDGDLKAKAVNAIVDENFDVFWGLLRENGWDVDKPQLSPPSARYFKYSSGDKLD